MPKTTVEQAFADAKALQASLNRNKQTLLDIFQKFGWSGGGTFLHSWERKLNRIIDCLAHTVGDE